MDVLLKLQNGEYEVRLSYPVQPKASPILFKFGRELTAEEAAQLPELHLAYTQAREEHKRQLAAWRQEENRLRAMFRSDLEQEFKMRGHPKADALWNLAVDYGKGSGDSGYRAVYSYYSELVDLLS